MSLRSVDSKGQSDTHAFETEMRLADRHPTWDFCHQITAVPSIHEEVHVQVIDTKRREVAGEAAVALRTLLDQKEHDEWLILPPTLRQQLTEKAHRKHPARVHLRLKFVHTKVRKTNSLMKLVVLVEPWRCTDLLQFHLWYTPQSIVLTRELQQLMKHRDVLVQKKREFIQSVIAECMAQLQ